jgi:DNA-binding CsgD family transcriptional regulator
MAAVTTSERSTAVTPPAPARYRRWPAGCCSRADAVEAVLSAAGHRAGRRAGSVAGLTAREVEVLRLAARGLSTRQIAQRLVMSPKTAGNHIEHIYAKIGVGSRAAASLFAVQHGLLPEQEFAAGGT